MACNCSKNQFCLTWSLYIGSHFLGLWAIFEFFLAFGRPVGNALSLKNGSQKITNTLAKMGFCYSTKVFFTLLLFICHLLFYSFLSLCPLIFHWMPSLFSLLLLLLPLQIGDGDGCRLFLFSFFFFFFFRSVMEMVCVWFCFDVLVLLWFWWFSVILLWKFVNLLWFSVILLWNICWFFWLKLLGSVDEVALGFFWVLVWFQLNRK